MGHREEERLSEAHPASSQQMTKLDVREDPRLLDSEEVCLLKEKPPNILQLPKDHVGRRAAGLALRVVSQSPATPAASPSFASAVTSCMILRAPR